MSHAFFSNSRYKIIDFGERPEIVESYLRVHAFTNYDQDSHIFFAEHLQGNGYDEDDLLDSSACDPYEFSKLFPDVVLIGSLYLWSSFFCQATYTRTVVINGHSYTLDEEDVDYMHGAVFDKNKTHVICTVQGPDGDDKTPILEINGERIPISFDLANRLVGLNMFEETCNDRHDN